MKEEQIKKWIEALYSGKMKPLCDWRNYQHDLNRDFEKRVGMSVLIAEFSGHSPEEIGILLQLVYIEKALSN